MKVNLTVEEQSFRQKLIEIFQQEHLQYAVITLRNGQTIDVGHDPKRNPADTEVRVWISKTYIEVDVAPGADVAIYEMVPISEIASIWYF